MLLMCSTAYCPTLVASQDLGKSDPYFVLKTEQGTEIYKSEHKSSTLTPVWDLAKFKTPADSQKILVEIYDHDLVSKDDLIVEGEIPYPLTNGHYQFKERV